jgi:serine/threonine protein kinase
MAIKVVVFDADADKKTEAALHSQLNHPNIINYIGHLDRKSIASLGINIQGEKSVSAFAMELGEYTLAEELKRISSMKSWSDMSMKRISSTTAQILSALACVHSSGYIHRDIKPENVIVMSNGTVKLCDFGLTVSTEAQSTVEAKSCVGTNEYMSDSRRSGRAYKAQEDVVGLGCIVKEMLKRHPLYNGRRWLKDLQPDEEEIYMKRMCDDFIRRCQKAESSGETSEMLQSDSFVLMEAPQLQIVPLASFSSELYDSDDTESPPPLSTASTMESLPDSIQCDCGEEECPSLCPESPQQLIQARCHSSKSCPLISGRRRGSR